MSEGEVQPLSKTDQNAPVGTLLNGQSTIEPSAKRRKPSPAKDDKPKTHVLIRPAPLPENVFYVSAPPRSTSEAPLISNDRLRPRFVPGRRSSNLSLRNHPTSPHPAGLAIWVLQKIEKVREDRVESEVQPHGGSVQWQPPNPPYFYAPPNYLPIGYSQPNQQTTAQQWPTQPVGAGYGGLSEEADAARLQSQRDRKTKQRSENWVKNKENDVVARAKLEMKKLFNTEPEASEAQRQEWIEQRIKEDFERLLNKIAAEIRGEIVQLAPFKTGFADEYFDAEKWDPGTDAEVLVAGKLIAEVLPGLTESRITERSQSAANALIAALEAGKLPPSAFLSGIGMLTEHTEMVIGIERVLAYLFSPKSGPSLSRHFKPRTARSTSLIHSAPPQPALATSWPWKEPATIRNSVRPPSSPAPPGPNSTYAQQSLGSMNPTGEQKPPYGAALAYPTYSAYSEYPTYFRAPYQYSPHTNPPSPYALPPHHSQPYLPTSAYSSNMPQQTVPYLATSLNPTPHNYSAGSPPPYNSHQAGNSAVYSNHLDVRENHQSTPRTTEAMTKPSVKKVGTAPISTPPASPSDQAASMVEIRGNGDASELLKPDWANGASVQPPAKNGALSENRQSPSIAPDTLKVETASDSSNATSPSPTLHTDGAIDEDTIVVYNSTRRRASTPSSTTTVGDPTSRYSTRDRKPTAKAISANLTPSLLQKSPLRTRDYHVSSLANTRMSPAATAQKMTGERTPQELEISTGSSYLPEDNATPQSHGPSAKAVDTPSPVVSPESEEPSQLRSSGRERKPTAKALALTKAPKSRKRSVSALDSPPPSKVVKFEESGRGRPSVGRYLSTSPDELGNSVGEMWTDQLTSNISAKHSVSRQHQTNTSPNIQTRTSVADRSTKSVSQQDLRRNQPSLKITLRITNTKILQDLLINEAASKAASTASDMPGPSQATSSQTKQYGTILQSSSSLLAFAAIAEDWSDSDDESENTVDSEQKYQARLTKALRKFPNFRKSSTLPATPKKSVRKSRAGEPVLSTSKGFLDTESPSSGAAKQAMSQVNTTSKANNPRMVSQMSSQLSSDNPALITRDFIEMWAPNASPNTFKSSSRNAIRPSPSRAFNSLGGPKPSNSLGKSRSQESTGSHAELMRARTAATLRGITINDGMSMQQIHKMIAAHDDGVHQIVEKSWRQSRAPEHASVTPLEKSNDLSNGDHSFNGMSYFQHQTPSSFAPLGSTPGSTSKNGDTISRLSALTSSLTSVHAHQTELRIFSMETIESPSASTKGGPRRSSSKPTPTNGSRAKIDLRGLNGEQPGGGTIINVKETQDVQKELWQRKASSERDDGSSGCASPVMPPANFTKGGKVIKFVAFKHSA